MVGTPCSSPHLSILWLRVIFLVFFKPSYSCCLSMSLQFAVVSRRSLRCLSQAGASPLSTPLDPVAAKLCFWLVIDLGKNFLASPSVEKDLCLVFVQNHCLPRGKEVCVYFLLCNSRQDYRSLWNKTCLLHPNQKGDLETGKASCVLCWCFQTFTACLNLQWAFLPLCPVLKLSEGTR